jgi:hypothetical protein
MASSARRIVVEFLGDDKSASRVAGSVDRNTSKLGDTFKKVGKAAAFGLGAGLVVAAGGMVKATQAAIEDQASANKLATALRNATGATDKQIASVEDYITKQSLATGVADDELRPAFQRLAEATGDVTKAQDLLSLAQDVSAGTGKSLEAVSTALMKAQNGSISGLSRLGIATKDAEGNTISLEQATKKMADTFGGQAAAKAETMQGKMDRLKVIFNETMETVGYKLIPIVTKLADVFIKDVVPALQKAAAWFGENIQPKLQDLGALIKRVFETAAAWVREHMDDIKATISAVVDTVTGLWDRFGKNILSIIGGALKAIVGVIKGVFSVIKGIFKVFHGILTGDWKEVWSGIKDILKGAWGVMVSLLKGAWNTVKEVFKAAGGVLKDVMGNIWDGIKDLAGRGMSWLIDSIKALPGKILKAAGNLFKAAGKGLLDLMLEGMKNAAGLISGIAGNVWDAVKSLLNGAIDKINSALEFKISLPGPDININTPDIPHLAKGTRNFGGGLALVGEQGPELVNLPRGSRVHTAAQTRSMAGSADGTLANFVIPIVIEGREIQRALLTLKRRNGNLELGLA